ncbi:MAG: long-chain fatty acid--CoA ligase [bacterium]
MGKVRTAAGGDTASRPWHGVWPAHLPRSLDYPEVPIWWILEKNLPAFAERTAVRFLDHESLAERETLTYAQIAARARAVAAGLQKLGVRKGDRVALCLANGPSLIVAFYGIWRAGAVAVPCNPMFSARELARQLEDSGARLLIAGETAAAAAPEVLALLEHPLVMAGEGGGALSRGTLPQETLPRDAMPFETLLAEDGGGLREVAIDPRQDLALLLYTGGTTGPPKGAMLTHRNIVANTIQFAKWYAFEPGGETCVSVIPMFHSGGLAGAMNVPLYSGAELLVMPRFNPLTAARAVERHRATRLFGVPTMFIAIMDHEQARRCDFSSLRACRTNAAPLPARVKADFDALAGHEVLVEGYGLTETSPLTHANPIAAARPGSIGVPLPDTDARIVDLKSGLEAPPGGMGEIVIRGPQVMKGYWNRAVETEAVLKQGWLRTGDVGTMDEAGYFTVVDRLKDVIISAGYKIWPREVEEAIYAHPAVKLVAVVGIKDDYRGEAVKAFVVPKAEYAGKITEAEIVAACKENLAAYKAPRIVEFREALPISGAGKMLRRLLRGESAG